MRLQKGAYELVDILIAIGDQNGWPSYNKHDISVSQNGKEVELSYMGTAKDARQESLG